MTTLQVPYVAFPQQVAKIKTELMQAVEGVLDSGMYVMGEKMREFEREFAAYCGAEYGAGVANGTCSLHLVLRGIGVESGDEVITVPNSFIASAGAIGVIGAKPVFVDVQDDIFSEGSDQIFPHRHTLRLEQSLPEFLDEGVVDQSLF